MNYRFKKFINKRVISTVLSAVMTINMAAVLPMSVFAAESQGLSQSVNLNEIKSFDDSRYQLFNESMSWINAKEYCENLGGHLVTITSEEEQKFVSESLLSIGEKSTYHIGLFRTDSNSAWEWVTGEAFDYSNWDVGEPNSSSENYVHMYRTVNTLGTWNNTTDYTSGNYNYSTSNAGFICEWDEGVNDDEKTEAVSPYTLFSGSETDNFQLNCWKSTFNGNLYTGSDFISNASEVYLNGSVDAVKSIITNGWIININERNENVEKTDIPDWDARIHNMAGDYEYSEEDIIKIQDKNVISGSVKTTGKVEIYGSTFEGDCYIIADGDITYNVNDFVSAGRVLIYSRNGNITINGTNINMNGIMYAPNGTVSFNTNIANINGRIFADKINFSGSIFNVNGSDSDWEMLGKKTVISKTYTLDDDFNEGEFDGLGLDITDELTLIDNSDKSENEKTKLYEFTEDNIKINAKQTVSKEYITSQDNSVSVVYDFSSLGNSTDSEHSYELINDRLTWHQAKEACENLGGQLVTITSQEEQLVIENLLNSGTQDSYWLGGTDEEIDGTWKWVTGEEFSFENWGKGQPDNSYSNTEDYLGVARVYHSWAAFGKWNDFQYNDGVVNGYICEWETASNKSIYNNHSYQIFDEPMTWTQAKEYCENLGGHLITISDASEYEFVKGLLDSIDKTHLWLGGYYDFSSSSWKWLDPTPFTYSNWDNGEPNRCYKNGIYEQYLMTYKVANPNVRSSKAYGWNDMFESGIFPGEESFFNINNYCFICEWDSADNCSATFSTTIKDFSLIDQENISPKPDEIQERSDGSAILTWKDVSGKIEIPFVDITSDSNLVRLFENSKLLISSGSNAVIKYLDDIDVPIMKYAESGSWTTIYDSKTADTVWKNIYWNGKLYDDSSIKVKACAGNSEDAFGEWIEISNHADIENLVGRYVKLCVEMNVSSTGKTPELFDITLLSDGADHVNYINNAPEVKISGSDSTFVSKKLTLISEIYDDAFCSQLSFNWSCDDENVSVSNVDKPYASFKFEQAGEYIVELTVSDGTSQATVSKHITVYNDEQMTIPVIELDVASIVKGGAIITGKVNNLNNAQVSQWEIVAGDEVLSPDNNGNFTFTAPEGDSVINVTAKATNALGLYGECSKTIIVDATCPDVQLNANKSITTTDENAVISAFMSDENGIKDYKLTLDGTEIVLDENYQYAFNPQSEGNYEFLLSVTDIVGNKSETTLIIKVSEGKPQDIKQPVLHFSYPKMVMLGNEADIMIYATDDVGVTEFEVKANGEVVTFDDDNHFKYTPTETGFIVIDIHAADGAGNVTDYQIKIPVVKLDLVTDKTTYTENEVVNIKLEYSDNMTIINQLATVDGATMAIESDSITAQGLSIGKHEVVWYVQDKCGETFTGVLEITVCDSTCPEVTVTLSDNNPKEGDTITASIFATDNSGIASVTAKLDGVEVAVNNDIAILKNLSAGGHNLEVTATDTTGNYTVYAYEFTVFSNQTQDTTPPELDVKIEYTQDNEIVINATATDNSGKATLSGTVNGEAISFENGRAVYIPDGEGDYVIVVRAEDANENYTEKTQTLTITEQKTQHELKMTVSVDNTQPLVNETVNLTVLTTSLLSDVHLICAASGGTVKSQNGGFTFSSEKAGVYSITITATDDYGNVLTQDIIITVRENSQGGGDDDNDDNPILSLIVNDGWDTAEINNEILIKATASDKDGIKCLTVTINGEEILLDKNGEARHTFDKTGVYTIQAAAEDEKGNLTQKSCELKVIDSSDENCPDAEIISPCDADAITAPTDIIGTVTDDGLLYYTLEYAGAKENEYTLISRGNESVDNGVLGTLDTTLLNNGYYKIRLCAYSSNYYVVDEIIVSVEGQMKIGNYSIAFEDMAIPIANFPLRVIRQYDSRNKSKSGDFGYGWNLNLTGMTVSSSCVMGENWYMDVQTSEISSGGSTADYNIYSLLQEKAHEISVDWGNGKADKFEMKVVPDRQVFEPLRYDLEVQFKAKGNTKSKLEAYNYATTGLMWYENVLMNTNLETFNPTRFKYTTEDGTVYIINTDTGVEKITDTNNNVITFTKNSITHSDGKTIVFTRDNNDRITKITGPSDQIVEYTYDSNGDLKTFSDIAGYDTSFVYDKNHYLTEIIDARGISAARNEYDENGRLIATIDADGNRMEFNHDIDGRREAVTDRLGNTTLMVYDDRGNVISQTDPMGNTTLNTYDDNGHMSSKTDALGNVTKYDYDSSGNMLSLTDAYGQKVKNTYNEKNSLMTISAIEKTQLIINYDEHGNLTSTEDALGNTTDYDYDNKGQVKSISDNIGDYMKFTYDSEGKLKSSTNGAGETATFTYDESGNCNSKTICRGSEELTENYSYNLAGNVTQVIYPDGSVTNAEYDCIGKITASVDSSNRRTEYEYDLFGNLTKIIYCDNTTETFEYDAEGRNTKSTDRLGRVSIMTYDKVGNMLSKTYSNGATESCVYDANYRMTSMTGINGGVTSYEYDALNRNTAIVDALGNRTEFAYNDMSMLESMTDPNGNVIKYEYDDNGNKTKTIMADGTSTSSIYDARGRISSQTDQNGYTTNYEYDGADRLISVTDAKGSKWEYTYNGVGELTDVKDANGNVTSYEYDSMGRVVKTINAAGKTAECTYDDDGNVLTSTNYAGVKTTYTYDELGQMIKQDIDGEITEFAYTESGLLSVVTDSTGAISYTYNDMDGLSSVQLADGTIINYTYDNSFRLTNVSTPFGDTSYEYDLMHRLTRVIDRNGVATLYEYDANGNRTAVKYANGIVTTYTYNEVNQLIYEETVDKDSNVVVKYAYTLGNAGERLKVEETDKTVDYDYDELYRLVSEKITKDGDTTEISYTYDSVGNRLTKTENGKLTEYSYNSLNQLVSETGITYKYDDNGNQTAKIELNQTTAYTYDKQNRLIRATIQSGSDVTIEEYEYDYAGNRTAKKSEGSTTKYIVDTSGALSQVLYELDGAGNVTTFYTRGLELISLERVDETRYYLYDGHGSVRALVDENGVVTDTYDYDAFGNLISKTGYTENNYLYCGEQFDANTGFYYLRARYMNPSTGTFISMDTYQGSMFDPVSLHKYLYANANPVMYSDPSGYFSLADCSIAMNILDVISRSLLVGSISGLMNVLFYKTHGYDVDWSTFWDGFKTGFIFGAGFGILGVFGKYFVLANIVSALVLTGFGIKGVVDAKYFYENDDPLWGTITLGFAGLSFFGAGRSFARANSILNVKANNNAGNYLSKKAPAQVEPGTKSLEGQYINNQGKVQPWKAYYDEYGRLIARTDYNAGNATEGIPDTHYHEYEYGPGKNKFEYRSHMEGEYRP